MWEDLLCFGKDTRPEPVNKWCNRCLTYWAQFKAGRQELVEFLCCVCEARLTLSTTSHNNTQGASSPTKMNHSHLKFYQIFVAGKSISIPHQRTSLFWIRNLNSDFGIWRGLLWKFKSHAAPHSLWALVSRLNLFHSTKMEWHLLTDFVCLHLSIPTQEIVTGRKMAYSVYLQM